MDTPPYPLLLEPVYQDYIWGGTRIPEMFGRGPAGGLCAESWEVADRPEGMSVVRNGPLAGRTLHELVEALGPALVGTVDTAPVFPLLIKVIDASKRLSLQVHPNDATAQQYGGEAKTEMWYMLDGTAEAVYIAGVKPGTDRAAFTQALVEKRVAERVEAHPAAPDTLAFIPGGLVHAIGEGCLILEIQQNSNTTYRVYDWDRVGKDGKPRELHVAQALQVIGWELEPGAGVPGAPQEHGRNSVERLVACPYFGLERMKLEEAEQGVNDGATFHVLFVRSGRVTVEAGGRTETLPLGTSCLLPAACPEYTVIPIDGPAVVLRIGGPR